MVNKAPGAVSGIYTPASPLFPSGPDQVNLNDVNDVTNSKRGSKLLNY